MNHTWKEYVNAQLELILLMLAALVDEGSDREKAKAAAKQISDNAAKLKAAIPADAGPSQ